MHREIKRVFYLLYPWQTQWVSTLHIYFPSPTQMSVSLVCRKCRWAWNPLLLSQFIGNQEQKSDNYAVSIILIAINVWMKFSSKIQTFQAFRNHFTLSTNENVTQKFTNNAICMLLNNLKYGTAFRKASKLHSRCIASVLQFPANVISEL